MVPLSIDRLSIQFPQEGSSIVAVRDASLTIHAGECVGIVGESGSGKSQIFMAAMGLLPAHALTAGSVLFQGEEILGASPAQLNRVRGSKLTMVFQDPMTSLTPHLPIGRQLAEVLVTHGRMSWSDAGRAALRMLERVAVPEPERRLRQYPHELSGGLRQRVMIGMSLLCDPALVIADEPTTALDVTVQAHIIELLRGMRRESHTAIALISHDIGVVAGLADRIFVLYGGRVVESGAVTDILDRTAHPYTAGLLNCVPDLRAPRQERMPSLPGQPPGAASLERGCAFAPRCPRATARCAAERPPITEDAESSHAVACHFPLAS